MLYFYWYLYLLLWILACLAPNISKRAQNRLLAVYCALWAFVFGFRRHDVGNDTPGYTAFFENRLGNVPRLSTSYGTVQYPNDGIEEGFIILSKVVNIFTENATIIFMMIGIIIWVAIYHLFKNYSKTPLLSLFFMLTITSTMFYSLEIAVRQSISMVTICYGILLLMHSNITDWKEVWKNKKAFMGLLLCLVSISIHRTSAVILCLFILLYFIKFTKVSAYIVIGIFALLAVKGTDLLSSYFDRALYIMGGFSNEGFNILSDRYMGNMDDNRFSQGAFIVWVTLTLLTVYLTKEDDINKFFFKLFIGAYCIHQIFQFSLVHTRIVALFIMLGYVMSVPDVCKKDKRWYFAYLMIGVFFLILNYGWFSKWPVQTDTALPYYFIWQ